MDVQIPCSVCTKVKKKNNICTVSTEFARYNMIVMSVQRSGDTRGAYDDRSCTLAIKYTTEDKCVKFYGIFKRDKFLNDV